MAIVQRFARIATLDHVWGNINNSVFNGFGKGEANPATGLSEGEIVFNQFPASFSPLLCKSWKCKQHKCLSAEENDGGGNLFSISDGIQDHSEDVIIRYPTGDEIHTYSLVKQLDPEHQVSLNRFWGKYSGPVAVVGFEPFEELLTPAGPGRALIYGTRSVMVEVEPNVTQPLSCVWSGELNFLDRTRELPYPMRFSYQIAAATWSSVNSVFHKRMTVVASAEKSPGLGWI